MTVDETLSGNDYGIWTEIGGADAALFSVTADESTPTEYQLTSEQFDAIVGTSFFSDIPIDGQIGFFTGSIAAGFALASLVLITKLAIGAIKTLLQRI